MSEKTWANGREIEIKGGGGLAKYCSKECVAICDFCKHYKDYGTDRYEGIGYCKKKDKEVAADGLCIDSFECFNIIEK